MHCRRNWSKCLLHWLCMHLLWYYLILYWINVVKKTFHYFILTLFEVNFNIETFWKLCQICIYFRILLKNIDSFLVKNEPEQDKLHCIVKIENLPKIGLTSQSFWNKNIEQKLILITIYSFKLLLKFLYTLCEKVVWITKIFTNFYVRRRCGFNHNPVLTC